MRNSVNVVLVGDQKSNLVRQVTDLVLEILSAPQIHFVPDFSSLAFPECLATDLVIVCQNTPDEHGVDAIESAIGTLPLARWIVGYGPWCESIDRTRRFWPVGLGVPVWALETRLLQERKVLAGNVTALPVTATREERFAHEWSDDSGLELTPGTVGIISQERDYAAMLTGYLDSQSVTVTNAASANVVLWDVDPLDEPTLQSIRGFHRDHPTTKIIALMNLPLPDQTQLLQSVGVTEVVGKLAPLSQLFQATGLVSVSG